MKPSCDSHCEDVYVLTSACRTSSHSSLRGSSFSFVHKHSSSQLSSEWQFNSTFNIKVKKASSVLLSLVYFESILNIQYFQPELLLFSFFILKAHFMQDGIHHDYAALIMRSSGINIHLLLSVHWDCKM